jgi:hypothetical protein
MEAAAMKEEIELYLPKDHNVAQDIIGQVKLQGPPHQGEKAAQQKGRASS